MKINNNKLLDIIGDRSVCGVCGYYKNRKYYFWDGFEFDSISHTIDTKSPEIIYVCVQKNGQSPDILKIVVSDIIITENLYVKEYFLYGSPQYVVLIDADIIETGNSHKYISYNGMVKETAIDAWHPTIDAAVKMVRRFYPSARIHIVHNGNCQSFA